MLALSFELRKEESLESKLWMSSSSEFYLDDVSLLGFPWDNVRLIEKLVSFCFKNLSSFRFTLFDFVNWLNLSDSLIFLSMTFFGLYWVSLARDLCQDGHSISLLRLVATCDWELLCIRVSSASKVCTDLLYVLFIWLY